MKSLARKGAQRRWSVALFVLALGALAGTMPAAAQPAPIPTAQAGGYGDDAAHGAYVNVNGIQLYYEDHGVGPVLLQLHGNGGDIASMAAQIAGLSPAFRVIAVDSRGHGKSEMGSARLTYEQMAEDVNALLDQLKLKSVHVLGWSDGGIVGLLLALYHPDKVAKLAIMGANLNPGGVHGWALDWVAAQIKTVETRLASGDTSRAWQHQRQRLDLMDRQPNIAAAELRRISAPTLVMAGDRDIVRAEHTFSIFENLPRAQLALFPGATHFIPVAEPVLFNMTVRNFFLRPFTRPDSRNALR